MKSNFRVLLLACLGSASALADPLASCKEQPRRPGERHFECDGFSLSASAQEPAFGQVSVLDTLTNAMQQDPKLRFERSDVQVGSEKRPGFRYRGASGVEVYGVGALMARGGMVRMIVCEEKKAAKCDAALTPFAASLIGDAPPASEASGAGLRFAGRIFAVRDGCESKTDGPKAFVRCGSANVSWVDAGDEAPPGDAWVYEPLKKALATQGTLTERQVPCLVDGAKATCHDIDIARLKGPAWHATAVMTVVRGQRVWVQCNISGDRGNDFPPPCGDLLKFP